MKKQKCTPAEQGFYGIYDPCPKPGDSAIIFMLGPSPDNFLVRMGSRWLHNLGCNVLALSPEPEDQGFHDLPIERFEAAVSWLKSKGNCRIGIGGGSATAMLALLGASFCPDITLTIAMTPCDFVMEGYYRDKLDGAGERPGTNQSIVTRKGKPLPYLPFAYRHPEYWQKIKEESRESHNMIASRKMFELSEKLHPLTEDELIPVENIRGTVLFAGAKDDCLWDTCRYIRRMQDRLNSREASCRRIFCIYEHGTHFLFPQSMLKQSLHFLSGIPVRIFQSGRQFPKECKQSRIKFDRIIQQEILQWKTT